jgi:hypothetical protein
MQKQIWIISLMLLAILASACKEDANPEMMGDLTMKITDAPIDDAEVRGVFVTVVDVMVDGESYAGFEGRQTIDLTAYQNGETFVLGGAELEAGTYNNLTLVLDLDEDASGNSPGCYVLTADNSKQDLAGGVTGTVELAVAKSFTIQSNSETELVIDVDLRKAVRYADGDDSDARSFRFAPRTELAASLRVVNVEEAGTLRGDFGSNTFSDPDRVVVYAYTAGSFERSTEETESDDDVSFQGAVTSHAAVKSGGEFTYELNYLPEGEYELVLVALSEEDNGSYAFEGFLQTSLSLNGSVSSLVEVDATTTTVIELSILGLIR